MPGVVLPFFHRPLSTYLNFCLSEGLVLRRIDEPAPPVGFLARAPEYAAAATIPRLLALLFERPAVRRRPTPAAPPTPGPAGE